MVSKKYLTNCLTIVQTHRPYESNSARVYDTNLVLVRPICCTAHIFNLTFFAAQLLKKAAT